MTEAMAEVIPEAMNEANPAAEALANIASFCLNYWKKPHSYIKEIAILSSIFKKLWRRFSGDVGKEGVKNRQQMMTSIMEGPDEICNDHFFSLQTVHYKSKGCLI